MSGLTRQEMFDRAVRGLRSQGYEQSLAGPNGMCLYASDEHERRCAWGWVDMSLTYAHNAGNVRDLRRNRIGLAAHLGDVDLEFALALQRCHDNARNPQDMKQLLRAFGIMFGCSWPGNVEDTWVSSQNPVEELP